jgi:hypothetical protein
MSPDGRLRTSSKVPPAFRSEVQSDPTEEANGTPTALAMAIAQAAQEAASHLAENGIGETDFEVTRIQVTVAPNPGPTSYKVTITPGG